MIQFLRFLNEINNHGWLPIEQQTTYNCYEKKRDFFKKIEEMKEMQLIDTKQNNGQVESVKLSLPGVVFISYMNILLKDKYELKP